LSAKCAEASDLFIAILNGNISAAERLVSLVTNYDDIAKEQDEDAALTRMAAAGYLIRLYGFGSYNFRIDEGQCQVLAAQYVPMYLEYAEKLHAVNHACKKYVAYILGDCYQKGWGVEKDEEKGFEYYKIAAESGYSLGENAVAVCYDNGQGVSQSYEDAVSWFMKAAEQGNAIAQFILGWCYKNGRGVSQSDEDAVSWYRKAAEQSYARAQCNLGECYEKGQGVPQDRARAIELYRLSAKQDWPFAIYKLTELGESIE
jgi:TPR repeat protein